MKRTHVTIDGITLSRAQVERAVKALDEPMFEQGDVVDHKPTGYRMIVIGRGTLAERAFDQLYWEVRQPHEYHLVAINGTRDTYSAGPEHLTPVCTAAELLKL